MFRCENGPCIQQSLRCNGHVDCPYDQSDELDCITTPRPTYRKSRVLELKLKETLTSKTYKLKLLKDTTMVYNKSQLTQRNLIF